MVQVAITVAVVATCASIIEWLMNRRETGAMKNTLQHRTRWEKARAERIRWLREHPYTEKTFNYPDYQRLWHRELDAEAAKNKCCGMHAWISWKEYEREQAACEAQS